MSIAMPARKTQTVRVLLADDSSDSLAGDRRLLQTARLQLVGESRLGIEAVAVAREVTPEVIAVSLEHPVARGIRTIEALTAALPDTPIIALSSLSDRDDLRRAMLAGARDYLVRPLDDSELANAVLAVYDAEQKRSATSQESIDGNHSGQVGELVTVFGAKGGIGRTTVACNLAVALAQTCKQRTALVDLDLQFGDVGLLLNIPPERTMADLLPVIDKLDSELLRGFLSQHDSGLMVLPAPTRPEDGEKIHAPQVRRMLEVLIQTYDYVIVDTPRQLSDNVIAALDLSSQVYCVASNQLASIKSTRLCLEVMTKWQYGEDKLKLIINQAHNGTGLPANDALRAVDYPLFWKVPYDGQLVASNQWGKPFVQTQPRAKISQNIVGLAQALSGARTPGRSLLSRLRGN